MPSSAIAVTVSAMLSVICSSCNVFRMRKIISLRRIALPLGANLTASALMICLFAGRPDALLKRMLAVVLILLSIYSCFYSEKTQISPTKVNVSSGLPLAACSADCSAWGPAIVLYFLSTSRDNQEYFADAQPILHFGLTGTLVRRSTDW
jgi:uncharacterized membrane protein